MRGNAKDLTVPPADSREFEMLAHRLSLTPNDLADQINGYMTIAADPMGQKIKPLCVTLRPLRLCVKT